MDRGRFGSTYSRQRSPAPTALVGHRKTFESFQGTTAKNHISLWPVSSRAASRRGSRERPDRADHSSPSRPWTAGAAGLGAHLGRIGGNRCLSHSSTAALEASGDHLKL